MQLQTEVDLETDGLDCHYCPHEVTVFLPAKSHKQISNKILADKMNTLKKGKAFEAMCKEIEKLMAEVTAEQRVLAAEAMLALGADENAIVKVITEKFQVSEDEAKATVTKAHKN